MATEGEVATAGEQRKDVLLFLAMVVIFVSAVAVRLFSVLRYEAMIHEFDPWFNYRTTAYLVDHGIYDFYNWFDVDVWYPLGRIVGGTLYPGLMVTSMVIHSLLNFLHFTVSARVVCVFLAPVFAGLTSLSTFWLTTEVWGKSAGLVSALFVALVPGYISRSVAGSYDNEGVAIFALITVFATFIKSVKTGSMAWSFVAVLSYYYMVNAWGGYIFIINLLPVYVGAMVVANRHSHKLYIAYSVFYVLGTFMCMQVHFVGFQAVQSGEHMAAAAAFFFLQGLGLVHFIRQHLSATEFKELLHVLLMGLGGLGVSAIVIGSATGFISPWTGRFWTLLNPTYAKVHIPIIASVSEHQPTTWSSYFFDLHVIAYLIPVGLYFCFRRLNEATIFIIMYGVTAIYFSGVMVRLMLVLAPGACVLGGIAASELLKAFIKACGEAAPVTKSEGKRKDKGSKDQGGLDVAYIIKWVILAGLVFQIMSFIMHSTWAASEMYSSPSIVIAARGAHGEKIMFDDYREAYQWLRTNTPRDAKIMSWWDYGYQITGMSNRTVLVDNNTWNNTHIATVGKAMASREEVSYRIMKKMDVEFALVIFGGMAGYSGDDINKFLWMVRIGGTLDSGIKEADYLSKSGDYTMGADGGEAMLNSLMYKMCYYRFAEATPGEKRGFDRLRGVEIGNPDIQLDYVEEAFTTEHWIIRIYRVKPEANRRPTPLPTAPLLPNFATASS